MYNYEDAMREDIKNAIEDNKEYWNNWKNMNKDARAEFLNDELWTYDDVTGNGSGSYTFCAAEALENIKGNEDLIADAVSEFGIEAETMAEHLTDWEYWDVTIRCYLLARVVWDVLDEIEDEEEDESEDEEFDRYCEQFAGCKDCPLKDCNTMEECKEEWKAIKQSCE